MRIMGNCWGMEVEKLLQIKVTLKSWYWTGISKESYQKYHGSVVIEPGTQKFTIKIVLCDLPEKLQITS